MKENKNQSRSFNLSRDKIENKFSQNLIQTMTCKNFILCDDFNHAIREYLLI